MKYVITALVTGVALFSQGESQAAGLEKTVPWSGHYAGIAGAAASSVNDSEALYFNPAGLTGSATDFSGNISPIFAQYSAPLPAANSSVNSNRSFVPSYGAFAKYAVNERLGLGIGAYAAGGSKAVFDAVDFTSLGFTAFKPTIQSNLQIMEYSLGAAYEVIDGLKIGAAWRVSSLMGDVSFLQVTSATYTQTALNSISNTQWGGFRVGAQYAPKSAPWGVGAFYRSQVTFDANPTGSGTVVIPALGITSAFNVTSSSLKAVLPWQVGIGGHFDWIPAKLRTSLQYEFTEYQANGTLGTVTAAGTTAPITLNWNNLHVLRLGGEYHCSDTSSLRAGYALTGQVVPASLASAVLSSPGLGHTVLLGVGKKFTPQLGANAAAEYSFAQGDSDITRRTAIAGTYKTNDLAAHLGVTYSL